MTDSADLVLECYGLAARVMVADASVLAPLLVALGPAWRTSPAATPSVTFELRTDGSIAVNGDPAPARLRTVGEVSELEWLMRHHVAEHAPDHVFIHAGVVSLEGAGIVLPGRSMMGKTTLVHELVHQGATYLSDEYAVVDAGGLVHPYPRPPSLRQRSLSPERATAQPIPVIPVTAPVPTKLVISTLHMWTGSWAPRRLPAGEAALILFNNSVPARSRPAQTLAAVRNVARGAHCWRSLRGEADKAAAEILRLACDQW